MSAYLTLIPLNVSLKLSKNVKAISVLKSDFELNQKAALAFKIHLNYLNSYQQVPLNILSKAISSRYLTLIPLILISEGV